MKELHLSSCLQVSDEHMLLHFFFDINLEAIRDCVMQHSQHHAKLKQETFITLPPRLSSC